ncbi:hypothetical protein HWV62_19211 [Athelia sp. TMB]|nr:hypothetical protein HWV62_19211 [Athelia sp. TMB]
MALLTHALLSALGTLLAYGLWQLYNLVELRWTSPLLRLPGPKSAHPLFGNINEMEMAENSIAMHDAWFREYGMTHKFHDLGGVRLILLTRIRSLLTILVLQLPVLCTKDSRAMGHILTHSDIYQKPTELRNMLARIFGEGLLVVEGNQHKQQRKIMNPAFGATQIRALTSVFTEKALVLRDRWTSELSSDPKGTRIDVLKWLNLATLDVIGQAGFNYQFDALNPSSPINDLNEAFKNLFNATQHFSWMFLLQGWFPSLRFIRTVTEKQITIAQTTMSRVGGQLLEDAKKNAAADKDSVVDKDLLSLLVKANMAAGAGGQKLTDVDVLAQVPTFLVAGHETTSSATTWCLFALAKLTSAQSRLREECLSLATDAPSLDELNSLAYLDCVVKETMRVHAPVPSTNRIAVQDDEIPVDEPWVDEKGVKHHTIKVAKGDSVSILIGCMNRSEHIWGADADAFRPERWEAAATLAPNGLPGIWGNQLTFLAGPRSCIGYRFALAEMKAIVFTLVRAFEFELAVPAGDITSKQSIVSRPIVKILCAFGTLFTYGLWRLYNLIELRWTSPLLRLPGPKNNYILFGSKEIFRVDNHIALPVLCTKDNRAVGHILSHSDIFQKPSELRNFLARIFGKGLLVVEGNQHRQQRKIMVSFLAFPLMNLQADANQNPAFGATQIRALNSIFTEKALVLRDRWNSELFLDPKGTRMDVLKWLNLATLDVIGQAGFNYQFDALNPSSPSNDLNEAFKNLFNAIQNFSWMFLLQGWFPSLRFIRTETEKQITIAQTTLSRVGGQLLEDAKKNAAADKDSVVGKDLLSLLVKANMGPGTGGQKLDDVDVLAQVPTFLVAGHETTSSATTWCLFALAQLKSAQSRLREECLSLATDSPSLDELNSLAYLDCVVKETMRVHAPVPSTTRTAVQADEIPLDEPWVDEKGVKHHSIKIAKGDTVLILIGCMNRSEHIWGKDADTFRPERWEEAKTLVPNGIPGIWGNQLTFLAGPRSCIGYRFALAEMKALIFTLVRSFEFELAVPAKDIFSKQRIVSRPIVKSEREAGNQMPLLVKPYRG